MKPRRPTWWPNHRQHLLLRAALLPGGLALEAWKDWRQQVDFESLEQGSTQLLPLAARNVAALGIDDDTRGRLLGIRRFHWTSNVTQLRKIGALLSEFHGAGFTTLVLKAVAVLARYEDHGLRPLDDVSILVPSTRALDAMAFLKNRGWTPIGWSAESRMPELSVSVRHSHRFRRGDIDLDLHWHALWQRCPRDADDELWQRSVPACVAGVSTRALDATDQLLHLCTDGTRWREAPTFLWAADALMVLRSGADIDWQRLVDRAQRWGLVAALRDALQFLAGELAAPVPTHALDTLRRARVPRPQRLEHAFACRAPGVGGRLPTLLMHHWRWSESASLPAAMLTFPRYLQRSYGLPSLARLPGFLARRATVRLRQRSGLR